MGFNENGRGDGQHVYISATVLPASDITLRPAESECQRTFKIFSDPGFTFVPRVNYDIGQAKLVSPGSAGRRRQSAHHFHSGAVGQETFNTNVRPGDVSSTSGSLCRPAAGIFCLNWARPF